MTFTKRRRAPARPERWIILPDTQIPFEDKRTLGNVERYMRDHRWDGWIQLGDLLDFYELSRFEEENARILRNSAILKTYAAGNEFLDRHQKILRLRNKRARMILIEGNHEFRIERWVDAHPEVQGLVEVPTGLKLAERGIEWVPFWSKGKTFKLGNAYFGHGRYTNMHHAKKHLDAYGVNFYYGHVHDVQFYSKENMGNDKTLEAGSLGCLCRYDQKYMQGRPSKWQQAFAVMYVFPDGYYNMHLVRIFKGRFVSPEGKVYGS